MLAIKEWFLNGGLFMYIVLFADLLALIVSITLLAVYDKQSHKAFLYTMLFLGLLPLLCGLAGSILGYTSMTQALALANPATKKALYTSAMAVIRIPGLFGGISTIVLLVISLVGIQIRRATWRD